MHTLNMRREILKYKITSKRLSESLYRVNMKPQELANAFGVSKSSISQYINGSHKPSELTAKRLAKILGVTPCGLWDMISLTKALIFRKIRNIFLNFYH